MEWIDGGVSGRGDVMKWKMLGREENKEAGCRVGHGWKTEGET